MVARVLAAISVEIKGTQMWIEERPPIMQSIVNSKSFFFPQKNYHFNKKIKLNKKKKKRLNHGFNLPKWYSPFVRLFRNKPNIYLINLLYLRNITYYSFIFELVYSELC